MEPLQTVLACKTSRCVIRNIKKRFQFTFGIEILSKYSVITKSLLNWMNWIPRSDLILHITALRHADEDVVLAQYKHRYSRVSGLNDLGLIRLCLWTVWTLFSRHYWQENWILDSKFNFFSRQNAHFCNTLIRKQPPKPLCAARRIHIAMPNM